MQDGTNVYSISISELPILCYCIISNKRGITAELDQNLSVRLTSTRTIVAFLESRGLFFITLQTMTFFVQKNIYSCKIP